MKRIKRMEEINADIVLLDSEDKQIIEEIVKYEEEIFHEGAIGIWNIKPFIKYGKVYALISLEARLISAIEIMKDFEEHKAYIYGFFTKESFRNKGYGDMFLKNILEELHNIYGH
jgi:GNAT superfamily N-acetyltransferase